MNAAHWTVPADLPAFAGHFPGRPIVPGVVLLDRAVQLVAEALNARVIGIGSAKFLSPVGPGATLDFSWTPGVGRTVRFDIASAGTAVAVGTLTLAA
jgi:3-hydroxymyristoyl/3-hydroxydecanoyl-(acyl carrier protein) dehydratase